MGSRGLGGERLRRRRGAGELVDELDQPGIGHALDEDAFRQRIHGTENLAVAALFEQVDRFFVPQGGAGAEQPVVGRFGAECRRKPLDYREELKQTLQRFPAGGCLLLGCSPISSSMRACCSSSQSLR